MKMREKEKARKITNAEDQHIRLIGLDWNEVVLDHGEVMPINPKLVREETPGVYQSNSVCRALLENSFISHMASCTPRIGGIAVEDPFAINDICVGEWSLHGEDLSGIERERVGVIPIADEHGAQVDIVVHAARPVDLNCAYRLINSMAIQTAMVGMHIP